MELKIIEQREVLGKEFKIYGTIENPLFLAKDVAEWIEHSDVSMMLRKIDEDEKVSLTNPNNVCGGQKAWFLTEDGLYEVLMQSRKPIAKAFKKEVKKILKQIRMTGKVKLSIGNNYFIDKQGNIYNKKGKKLKLQENKKGYLRANLYLDNKNHKLFFVHRLVMMTFCPIEGMENLQVNHKNGNKKDNRLENLEWCTNLENMQHSYKEGIRKPKLTKEQMDFIDNNYDRIYTNKYIANKYNITRYDVLDIVKERKRNLNLTKKEIEEIKELYKNKLTYVEIARILGVNESIIRHYIKYNKFFSINKK